MILRCYRICYQRTYAHTYVHLSIHTAGWDKAEMKKCNGLELDNNGIDVNNRALVFLIETADAKQPKDQQLGGYEEVRNSYINMTLHDSKIAS